MLFKEALLGVSSRSSEAVKLIIKSAKNFPQRSEGDINYDLSPDQFPYHKQGHIYCFFPPSSNLPQIHPGSFGERTPI